MTSSTIVCDRSCSVFFNQNGAEVARALCGHDQQSAKKENSNEVLNFIGDYPVIISSNEHLRVRIRGDEEAWSGPVSGSATGNILP